MLAMANVEPGDIVYDLGSGDGRVIITAAREFGAQAVGIEIEPLRYLWTQLLITLLGLRGSVRVVWGDLFKLDLSQADVVVTYLLGETNQRLMLKFVEELRPEVRLVSRVFSFPGWSPKRWDEKDLLFMYVMGELFEEPPSV